MRDTSDAQLISRGDFSPTPGRTGRDPRTRVQIQRWREHKKDTRIGFFNIELFGQGMVIKGLALHQKAEEFSISGPRRRDEASDGRLPSVVGFSRERFRESSIIAELKKDGYISVPDGTNGV
jgi:hypothetical protein